MGSISLREKLMQTRRLFVDTVPELSAIIALNPSEHHYATRVLRLKNGQGVELITPEGCMDALLESITADTTHVRILSSPEIRNEPSVSITLFQGLPDHLEKLELIIQKSVELGVDRIVTFTSRYTDAKHLKMKVEQKMERLRKIAKEAVRQCGRSRIPDVEGTVSIRSVAGEIVDNDIAFLFFEKQMETRPAQVQTPEKVALIVGAEGGFSDEEAKMLTDKDCTPIHLPGRILRTETAALAGITLIQREFGDYRHAF